MKDLLKKLTLLADTNAKELKASLIDEIIDDILADEKIRCERFLAEAEKSLDLMEYPVKMKIIRDKMASIIDYIEAALNETENKK